MEVSLPRSSPVRSPDAEKIALHIITLWEKGTHTLDYLLAHQFQSLDLPQAEKARVTEWVSNWGRLRGTARHLLATNLNKGLDSLPPTLRRRLELVVCRVLAEKRTPKPIIISSAVNKIKREHGEKLSGLSNAVLRKIGDFAPVEPTSEQLCEHLANTYSHPQWMVQRWLERWGEAKTQAQLEWDNLRPNLYLRWNRLRGSGGDAVSRLQAAGIEFAEVAGFEGYFLLNSPFYSGAAQLVAEGFFTVQDPSAALSVQLLNPQPGTRILDLCAAPGGKTTYIAELIDDQGQITALDTSVSRMQRLRDSQRRMGIKCIRTYVADSRTSQQITAQLSSAKLFDAVLVDAPCSGLGVLSRRSDLRWRRKLEDFTTLIPLQHDLIRTGAQFTRPGGALVYSTCTVEPEENEEIVQNFLTDNLEFGLDHLETQIPAHFFTGIGQINTFSPRDRLDGVFAVRMVRSPSDR